MSKKKPELTWIRHSSIGDHFIEKNTKWPHVRLCTKASLICSLWCCPFDWKLCVCKKLELFLHTRFRNLKQTVGSHSCKTAQENVPYMLMTNKQLFHKLSRSSYPVYFTYSTDTKFNGHFVLLIWSFSQIRKKNLLKL